jgi:hypothetical protein
VSTRMSSRMPARMSTVRVAVAVVAASACFNEAMLAPAVGVAPVRPGTYSKEDPVVEESRPVKAHWRTGVGSVIVIAVSADWRNADFHCDLCFRRRRQSQACE